MGRAVVRWNQITALQSTTSAWSHLPRVSYTAAMAAMAACDWCRALELLEELRLKQMFPTVAGIETEFRQNSRAVSGYSAGACVFL